jgi:hypothetical protein
MQARAAALLFSAASTSAGDLPWMQARAAARFSCAASTSAGGVGSSPARPLGEHFGCTLISLHYMYYVLMKKNPVETG